MVWVLVQFAWIGPSIDDDDKLSKISKLNQTFP
jgi:hypothetical protein